MGDERNGIAAYEHKIQHSVDWESTRVQMTALGYWNKRILDAIQIQKNTKQ